jgi:hypothetical protein
MQDNALKTLLVTDYMIESSAQIFWNSIAKLSSQAEIG